MRIQEAMKSGKPFRRECWQRDDFATWEQGINCINTRDGCIELTCDDVLADDWCIQGDWGDVSSAKYDLTPMVIQEYKLSAIIGEHARIIHTEGTKSPDAQKMEKYVLNAASTLLKMHSFLGRLTLTKLSLRRIQ